MEEKNATCIFSLSGTVAHLSPYTHTSPNKHADCVTKASQVQMRKRQSFSYVAGVQETSKAFQHFRRHPGTNCLLDPVFTPCKKFFYTRRRCKDTAISSAASTLPKFSHRYLLTCFTVGQCGQLHWSFLSN